MKNPVTLVGILVVVVAAIVLGLAATNVISLGNTHPSPSAPSSPQMTPTSSPVFAGCGPLDESVPLALRIEAFSETGRWWVISVYADGQVITPAPLPGDYGGGAWMVARRLSASGVAQLRAAVMESGLFDHSASYNPVGLPGVEGPAYGGGGFAIALGSGVDAVVVRWVAMFPDDEQYFEPSPERPALDTLAERLIAFDSWLPDDGWGDRDPCTVQALRFRVFIDAQANGGAQAELPPDITDVPWPLGGEILSWGADVGYQPPNEPYHMVRCAIVARADASRVVDELRDAGALDPFTFATTLDGGPYIEYRLGDRAANRIVQVLVQPLLPDDEQCIEANHPYGGGI